MGCMGCVKCIRFHCVECVANQGGGDGKPGRYSDNSVKKICYRRITIEGAGRYNFTYYWSMLKSGGREYGIRTL